MKKDGKDMNKKISRSVIAIFLFVLSGCATVRSTTAGVKSSVQSTWQNIAGSGGSIERADAWIKENLW